METHHPGRAHENMRRPRTVLAILDRSSQRLRNIAANLEGGRAGWTDQGLEYSLFSSGQRSLGGFAENSWVTFTVEVRPPGFYDVGVLTWEVEAEMAVRCDHPTVDCGMHRIEFREAPDLEDPVRAIAALDEFTSWLVERSANGVGRSSWTVSWTGRPGGSHPPGSHGTERDSLPPLRSSHLSPAQVRRTRLAHSSPPRQPTAASGCSREQTTK